MNDPITWAIITFLLDSFETTTKSFPVNKCRTGSAVSDTACVGARSRGIVRQLRVGEFTKSRVRGQGAGFNVAPKQVNLREDQYFSIP